MKKYTYTFYTEVKTIEAVIEHMQLLNIQLMNTDLQNLIAFNNTYLIITTNVYRKLGQNFFNDDALIKRTDINFAKYYFKALHNYLSNKKCPPAWEILFDSCKKNKRYQFVYMALGVNAHVNNDLPLTLFDVLKGSMINDDFLSINQILKDSIEEVVKSLHEKQPLLNFLENNFETTYSFFLHFLIKNWRNHAWNNYKKLLNKNTGINDIEAGAKTIAKKLDDIKAPYQIINVYKLLIF